MPVVALVPLRGGSKSIPLKNIKPIAGKPLCAWVLRGAVESGIFDRIVVSTDDERIAEVVRTVVPSVEIIRRPANLATDSASTEAVMMHVAAQLEYDVLCTIQATSPLTTANDLREAYQEFIQAEADSLVTAVRMKRFFWTDDGEPMNYSPEKRPMRQDFPGTLMENGAFYFTRRAILDQNRCRLGGKIHVFEMQEDRAVEIDEPADWTLVERYLLVRRDQEELSRVARLKYFFFDVDGTLTDGAMYYSFEGEVMKRFFTRDGLGMRLLRDHGIDLGIITSEDSAIVRSRAEKLQIPIVYMGVYDKASCLQKFCQRAGISCSQVGFMGDDVNDLPAIAICGYSGCPSDAVSEVRTKVDYICASAGGRGAVRELCDSLRTMLGK